MGYTTDFWGEIKIEPPLNEQEISFLNNFGGTRRMARRKGAYFCKDTANFGQNDAEDVIDHNGTGCITHEYIPNPDYDPSIRYGQPGYQTPNIRRELAEPLCPPEWDTPAVQPGLWCQWVPTDDGSALVWNETEKFYNSADWMVFIIDNFLKPGAFATTPKGQELVALAGDERFAAFTFDHVCSGVIDAQGEENDDTWRLVVIDNVVRVDQPTVTWPDLPPGLISAP